MPPAPPLPACGEGYRIWLAAWRWQRARRLLHLSPRAGRGRFASGALATRSKSGEGACPQAQTRGHAPSPGFLAALGIRPRIKSGAGSLPARGERSRKWLCRAPDDDGAALAASQIPDIAAPSGLRAEHGASRHAWLRRRDRNVVRLDPHDTPVPPYDDGISGLLVPLESLADGTDQCPLDQAFVAQALGQRRA